MQTPKEEIRNSLLESAGKLFLRKGFLKTSMREIARDAGVGLANIYNYFRSKDEIFRTVVQPVTLAFEQMAHSHHDSGGTDVLEMYAEPYLRKVTDEYVTLINSHRRKLEILLFRAQGSSLEDFRERYTDRTTAAVKEWLGGMETPAPGAEHRRLGFFNPPAHGVDVHAVRGDHHAPGKAAGDEAGDCRNTYDSKPRDGRSS